MNGSNVLGGSARTVVLGKSYVFKIQTGELGIEENKSEIELSKKSRFLVNTQSLGDLGVTSLDVDKILSLKNKKVIDNVLLLEIISVSNQIRRIIKNIGDVDVSKINVQKRLNLVNGRMQKYVLYLMYSDLYNEFVNLVHGIPAGIDDSLNHTISSLGNYGFTEDNEILLLDGGIIGKGKELFLERFHLIHEILNNKILINHIIYESDEN